MLQVAVAPGTDAVKVRRIRKQLVAGGDVNGLAIERDTAQAPVPAAPAPVNVRSVPVDGLCDRLPFDIDQVDAAVALALVTAANDRRCYKLNDWCPPISVRDQKRLRRFRLIVRGRCSVRSLRQRGSPNQSDA